MAAPAPADGPVMATAKIVSLPGFHRLCHYADTMPFTIGRGASHVQPWTAGTHANFSNSLRP